MDISEAAKYVTYAKDSPTPMEDDISDNEMKAACWLSKFDLTKNTKDIQLPTNPPPSPASNCASHGSTPSNSPIMERMTYYSPSLDSFISRKPVKRLLSQRENYGNGMNDDSDIDNEQAPKRPHITDTSMQSAPPLQASQTKQFTS